MEDNKKEHNWDKVLFLVCILFGILNIVCYVIGNSLIINLVIGSLDFICAGMFLGDMLNGR